jgi:hypothetical protein
MIAVRPCGACAELVPADTGCQHWKPGTVRKRVARRSTRGSGPAPTVAEFQRVMGVTR